MPRNRFVRRVQSKTTSKSNSNSSSNNNNNKKFGIRPKSPVNELAMSKKFSNNGVPVNKIVPFDKILEYLEKKNLKNILALVNDNRHLFKGNIHYDMNIENPLIDKSSLLMSNPTQWYIQYNEHFYPMFLLLQDLRIPEFKFILLGLVKDLVILCITQQMPRTSTKNIKRLIDDLTKKFPADSNNPLPTKNIELLNNGEYTYIRREASYNNNNNKISRTLKNTNANSDTMENIRKDAQNLLGIIEGIIVNGYLYKDIIKVVLKFITLFTFGNSNISLFPESRCKKYIDYILKTFDTPYIVIPLFQQISFFKTVNLARAPILNFRINNSRKIVHDWITLPCNEIEHDLMFHATSTHDLQSQNNKNLGKIRNKYDIRNKTLKSIEHLINYNENNMSDSEEQYKYFCCCMLFDLMHERGSFINKTITLDKIIEALTNYLKSMKLNENQIKLFLEDYAFGKKYEFILSMDGFKNLENFITDLQKIK
jgi:hypothetical protein